MVLFNNNNNNNNRLNKLQRYCSGLNRHLMPVVAFFITATKLAGVLVTVTVAANAFSYNRFRKKNLMPIPSSLIDESDDILAAFNVYSSEDGASSGT